MNHFEEKLKNRLLESGICSSETDLKGCTEDEITDLENTYGFFNENYRNFLKLIGHNAGILIDKYEFAFYYDRLIEANENIRHNIQEITKECLEENCPEEIPQMPSDYFVISARYGGDNPNFILTNSDSEIVYLYNDDGEIIQYKNSIWEWLLDFIKHTEKIISENRTQDWIKHIKSNA
ncbi:hypothetical protein COW36_21120 [bacterium (Candidatus Blackallbacteria) CG17_big_fil_post_rev_8_21_14_2_50_48_46]|uniref:Knr4/Smi1-like domain-containing protein n=1 Tax=bacterium (Candidatus Blackallbacteria) CG17_big_fil_post_rev_8_21_14_2_50_48_46 TaxID=2014261 RepID=A0A2M7FZ42_9BACT|nr:MAG: hypothetical protein COW64_14430 [bacterium (Candidatus Blackallbacteria) CG18_big_fil_WC_8_21_14_2_50_49_26]PIW14542.1 MAG: hypothetical protein COW36_21120 [bacterium (Candidatus Blackallbacteria) CG17_big_fil_post_rev_8_21_14_2_50_48_46]PIW47227.1 MAG: hypothetical protein COW20_13565 [bacterium (Candidatus Blackallbacteria) CG13_big_fil_rev_8_21_14_2_50_49_14]